MSVWNDLVGLITAPTVFPIYQQALYQSSQFPVKTLPSPGCVKPGSKREAHVRFEDTIFEGNGGLITDAVYIHNAYTTFERCTFRNNFAVDNSGHVYSAYGTGKVDFKGCKFSSTKVNMTISISIISRGEYKNRAF